MDVPDHPRKEDLPIEWVDTDVCADEFENRRLLRTANLRWKVVPPGEDGMPSGLVEVVDPDRENSRKQEAYRDLLSNPRDAWSDFVDVRELPPDAAGVPYWIHRRAEAHRRWEATPRLPGSKGGKGGGQEPYLPVRCETVKSDGTRCWAWAADKANEGRCRAHAPGAALAANMGHQIALAKVKIMQAMPAMVDELEDLALNAASEQVKLKAVTEMMDRGGVNSSTDINMTGGLEVSHSPAEEIRSRLDSLAERLAAGARVRAELEAAQEGSADVVDGEVVPETETA